MLDMGFADDMGGMPDVGGMFDMDGIEVIGFADSRALVPGIEPVIGSFIAVLSINGIRVDDSSTPVSVIEPCIRSFIDIPCIAVPADVLESPIIIPDIPGIAASVIEEESSPRPLPA